MTAIERLRHSAGFTRADTAEALGVDMLTIEHGDEILRRALEDAD